MPTDRADVGPFQAWLDELRQEGLTGMDLFMCWMKHHIQPLQARQDLLGQWSGVGDPTRISQRDLGEEELKEWLGSMT